MESSSYGQVRFDIVIIFILLRESAAHLARYCYAVMYIVGLKP